MDDADRSTLLRQLFALITARFEDGAGRAIDGQARACTCIDSLIAELHDTTRNISVLLDAAAAIQRMPD